MQFIGSHERRAKSPCLPSLQVEYDSALVGPRDIISSVADLGYQASLMQADDLSSGMEERAKACTLLQTVTSLSPSYLS